MIFKKLVNVIVGSLIMALGIRFIIAVNLGSDPMTMFWIGISNLFSISVGQANILTSTLFLLIVFFLDRKQLNVGSILNPLIVTFVLDHTGMIDFSYYNFVVRLALIVCAFIILSFGIALYSFADFGKGSYEALVFAMSEKTNFEVGKIRTMFDVFFAFAGFMLGAILNVGTLIAIVSIGSGIQFFIKRLESR